MEAEDAGEAMFFVIIVAYNRGRGSQKLSSFERA